MYKNLLIVLLLSTAACKTLPQQTEKGAITRPFEANKGQLVHVVYFTLKPDADVSAMVARLYELKNIPQVLHIQVGRFANLGDPRALSNYNLTMHLVFADKAAYDVYQLDTRHLTLKADTGTYLAGPPATYDFLVE